MRQGEPVSSLAAHPDVRRNATRGSCPQVSPSTETITCARTACAIAASSGRRLPVDIPSVTRMSARRPPSASSAATPASTASHNGVGPYRSTSSTSSAHSAARTSSSGSALKAGASVVVRATRPIRSRSFGPRRRMTPSTRGSRKRSRGEFGRLTAFGRGATSYGPVPARGKGTGAPSTVAIASETLAVTSIKRRIDHPRS